MKDFTPDYKNTSKLAPFVSESFSILPSAVKQTKASLQRRISREIKRARYLSLMPYCDQHNKI
jgi:small subunit ribosomal protein S18